MYGLIGDTLQIELEFRMMVFREYPDKKPGFDESENQRKILSHIAPSPGIEPGLNWWEASALTSYAIPAHPPRNIEIQQYASSNRV